MCAVPSGYIGAGVLIMCQHVRSAERMHWSGCVVMCQHVRRAKWIRWSGCAYHVPACVQFRADTLERVCLSCACMCAALSGYTGAGVSGADALQRVCLSCACMCAVLSGYTGAGVLIMSQRVRTAERIRWSGCAYHVPACAQC